MRKVLGVIEMQHRSLKNIRQINPPSELRYLSITINTTTLFKITLALDSPDAEC